MDVAEQVANTGDTLTTQQAGGETIVPSGVPVIAAARIFGGVRRSAPAPDRTTHQQVSA